jgi:hypothetical protein
MQHCAGFISAGSLYMFRAQAPIIRSIQKLVHRPLVHVLSLPVSHHISLLGAEGTVLHQVGVSFDLYYDARKHKIKKMYV